MRLACLRHQLVKIAIEPHKSLRALVELVDHFCYTAEECLTELDPMQQDVVLRPINRRALDPSKVPKLAPPSRIVR